MSHPEPHLITLLALGEPACSPAQLAHIESCPGCTADLDRLRAIMAPAEDIGIPVWTAGPEFRADAEPAASAQPPSATAPVASPAPPPGPAAGPLLPPAVVARVEPAPPPAPVWVPASEAAPVTHAGPVAPAGGSSGARTALLAVAAAVLGLAIGVGGTLALDSEDTVTTTPAPIAVAAPVTPTPAPTLAPTVLATAALLATATDALSGNASVVEEGASRVLQLRLSGVAPSEGYREVWLLTPDATGLVSLGVLTGTSGDLVIPAGLDLAAYPDVDITQEALDGNPARSAASLARGTLS